MNISRLYRIVVPLKVRRLLKKLYFFTRTQIGLEYSFTTLQAYKIKWPNHFKCINNVLYNLFYSNPKYEFNSDINLHKGKTVRSCCAVIKDACCFAGSDAIVLHDNSVLYELRENYKRELNRINSSDGIIIIKDEKLYRNIRIPNRQCDVKVGILLTGVHDTNYYHLTFQCFSKLREVISLNKSIPLLVNKRVYDVANYRELLSYLNIHNRNVILLEPDICYKVESLYYIPIQMLSVPSYKFGAVVRSDDDQYCYDSIKYIREMVLPYKCNNVMKLERIFISRRKTTSRRSYNEIECYEALKKYGFVEVFPEEMSIGEQVALFNNASCIVGATGAAFTNLIYCHEKCSVLIMMGYRAEYSIFSSLSFLSKCEITYLYDENNGCLTDASNEHSDFHINTDTLETYIKRMIYK